MMIITLLIYNFSWDESQNIPSLLSDKRLPLDLTVSAVQTLAEECRRQTYIYRKRYSLMIVKSENTKQPDRRYGEFWTDCPPVSDVCSSW